MIPIVVGSLGEIPNGLNSSLKNIGITVRPSQKRLGSVFPFTLPDFEALCWKFFCLVFLARGC